MLRLHSHNELGILRIIHMRTERNLIHRNLSRDCIAFQPNEFIGLILDFLWEKGFVELFGRGKHIHWHNTICT